MSTQKYTADQVSAAIRDSEGFVSKAASILGCSVQSLYNYRDRYQSVKEAWEETYERRLDFVESKLMQLIRDGNVAAVIFFLKTQGKARGYVERVEHVGENGGPVRHITTIEVHHDKPTSDD